MKKIVFIILAVCMVISVASSAFASKAFTIELREWFPGINTGDITIGAMASGNIFFKGKNVGYVNIAWSHNGEGIEVCEGKTTLLSIRIEINFNDGGRLVLVGPFYDDESEPEPVTANWDFDDPSCPDGNCPLLGYTNYLDPDIVRLYPTLDPYDKLEPCETEGDPYAAYIAQILSFEVVVVRQRIGSRFRTSYSGGEVFGFLDHRPIISPAVIGEISLH